MARTALGRGHTDLALAALRRHTRAYPNGQLAEERDGLLVQALVAKGEFAQARQRAARFHRQHPHSLFWPVVDEALRSIP
jgi:outer membrane protein assembly factor BamD (BamD/ComL family)